MFSNFTEKARAAISKAHDSACELGHYYVGSEHLLLGLIREGTGVAAKALLNSGINEETVIEKIREMIGIKEAIDKDGILRMNFDVPHNKRYSPKKIEYPGPYTDVRLEADYKNKNALLCDLTFWAVEFLYLVNNS